MVMDEIRIGIKALFNDEGIKEARKRLQAFQDISQQTGLSMNELSNRMDATGVSINKAGQTVQKNTGNFMSQQRAVSRLQSGWGALAGAANQSNRSIMQMNESLNQSRMALSQNSQGSKVFQNQFTGAMNNSKQAADGARRATADFRMDLLSVMFAAMAARRVISGLFRPAMKSAGVFDTWGSILEILFLPVAILIQKALLKVLGVVSKLPKNVKLLIGVLGILSVVVLTAALVWSQLALAATSMGYASISAMVAKMGASVLASVSGMATGFLSALGTMATAGASAAGTIASAITLPIIAAVAILVGIVLLLNEAWASNWFGIRQAVGKAVKFIGKNIETLVSLLLPPLGILNKIITTINQMTGSDLPTLGSALSGVEDAFVSAGDAMIESGNKIDKGQKQGSGFLGFQLTGQGGLLHGGIGGIGDKVGGMLGFGGPKNINTPSSDRVNVQENNINQNINISRGTGNKSDFAFSKQMGRELEKANESAVSKLQSGQ